MRWYFERRALDHQSLDLSHSNRFDGSLAAANRATNGAVSLDFGPGGRHFDFGIRLVVSSRVAVFDLAPIFDS